MAGGPSKKKLPAPAPPAPPRSSAASAPAPPSPPSSTFSSSAASSSSSSSASSASASASASASFSSFHTPRCYCRALLATPRRLAARSLAIAAPDAELTLHRARSGTHMQRKLRWYDVLGLGVGGMLGAGVFVATGGAARFLAGPSVVASFAVAGLAALLSALCYSEFAVMLPVAGGAFSYLRITFGELAAYLTGANLIMEYVISNAAVARSFTSNLSAVFGIRDPAAWRVFAHGLANGYNRLDFPAFALVLLMTFFICRSTKNSCTFNMLITVFHLSLIVFIIVAGFAKGSFSNFTEPDGFTPFGAKGIFNGAAIVFYSYSGYDSVSTLAEESQKPAKTMPIGISGSVLVVTVLYCLMATSLVLMVPYDQVDIDTPFPSAFRQAAGWKWAVNMVALCACIGIVSSLMVAMLGQARYLCVIGRANIVPQWFAHVNSTTGTPANASISLGACTAIVALFTELDVLMDLICIGTLFVYYMVANALIVQRYVAMEPLASSAPKSSSSAASSSSSATHTGLTWHGGTWPTAAFLVVITALSVAFVTIWRLNGDRNVELSVCAAAIALSSIAFKALVPPAATPSFSSSSPAAAAAALPSTSAASWRAPMMPFVAVASIFLNVFLAGSLKALAFRRFGIWSAGALCFYVLYSVHAAHDADQKETGEKRSRNNGTKEGGGGGGGHGSEQQLQLVCV